jgi:hypothetical protein
MKGIVLLAATALSALAFAILGHSETILSPNMRVLASDVHVMIGGQHIVVPVVAIRQPDYTFDLAPRRLEAATQKFQLHANDPAEPVNVEKINLSVRQYQYTGERRASVGICAMLSRKWSEAVCRGEVHGLLSRLPEKFDLLDRSRLDLLQSEFTVGGERVYDHVKDLGMRPGVTEIGCDKQSRFCTSMVEVLPGLLAVWTVWADEQTGSTAQQMAETQGPAIVQFVLRAIGPAEDPTLVDAD